MSKTLLVQLFFITLLITSPEIYALEIALSFDDAPASDSALMTGIERTQQLIHILKEKKVKEVAFFCNTHPFTATKENRLKQYSDAGHIIANHTASHPSLMNIKTSAKHFIQDITQAEYHLKRIPNYRQWFRFPYLRQNSFYKAHNNRLVEKYLSEQGYKHGYVTIKTNDWLLDELVAEDIQKGYQIDKELVI